MTATSDNQLTLSNWAQRQAPHLTMVDHDITDPPLTTHNVVAVLDNLDEARTLLTSWQTIDERSGDVGLVVLGTEDPNTTTHTPVDAPGVLANAGKRGLMGAIPGAIVGAVLFGVVGAMMSGAGLAIGLAVAGAFFIGMATAVWGYVMGPQFSSAYQQTFVDPEVASMVVVSIHGPSAAISDAALAAASEVEALLFTVRSDGSTTTLSR